MRPAFPVIPPRGARLDQFAAITAPAAIGPYAHAVCHKDNGETPVGGAIPMTGRIAGVLNKGKAAVVEIEVNSSVSFATLQHLPTRNGRLGWRPWVIELGCSRGRQAHQHDLRDGPGPRRPVSLDRDRHPVHIDPEVASANGLDRPILHVCALWAPPPGTLPKRWVPAPRTFVSPRSGGQHSCCPGTTSGWLSRWANTALSMDAVPRISRAQSLAVLSSMANISPTIGPTFNADLDAPNSH